MDDVLDVGDAKFESLQKFKLGVTHIQNVVQSLYDPSYFRVGRSSSQDLLAETFAKIEENCEEESPPKSSKKGGGRRHRNNVELVIESHDSPEI